MRVPVWVSECKTFFAAFRQKGIPDAHRSLPGNHGGCISSAVFNSVNDRTLEAVLQAPKEARLPVIVQTSITLKLTYWRSNLAFLREAQAGKEQESTRLFNQAVKERSEEIQRFGSM
jgi:hypothetical protein